MQNEARNEKHDKVDTAVVAGSVCREQQGNNNK